MNPSVSTAFSRFFLPIVLLLVVSCGSQNDREAATDDNPDQPAMTKADSSETGLASFVSFSPNAVMGGSVYIPVYSHIYQHNQKKTFDLTATLSIRNTDLRAGSS